MSEMVESDKIDQQRQLYGEPIGGLVRTITAALGITQARVAEILGLSPAMLSQLVGGHRVKIGNPLAVARLQSLLALSEEAPDLTQRVLTRRLEEIKESRATLTTTQVDAQPDPAALRRALREVASDRELREAAQAIETIAPRLAELLRIHGTD